MPATPSQVAQRRVNEFLRTVAEGIVRQPCDEHPAIEKGSNGPQAMSSVRDAFAARHGLLGSASERTYCSVLRLLV
jgi:hypothetical protein